MNNSVYINDKVGKFYYVANDEDYCYFELTMLQDEGFHFVSYLDKEEKNAILDEIYKLPVAKMIKLLKKLEERWRIMKCYRFNLSEVRFMYLQDYYDEPGYEMEFDREDYLAWLKEDCLPEYFNDIDYNDLDVILNFLKENKDNFYFEFLRGNCQGDYCYAWNGKVDKYQDYDREYLENVAYSSWISIFESNNEGEIGEPIENVPDYYVYDGKENTYLSEYMTEKYEARLAKEDITYY